MRLTGRAGLLIVVAVAMFLFAAWWRLPALTSISGLALGLVLVAVVLTWLGRPRLSVHRDIDPLIVEPGETFRVRTRVHSRSAIPVSGGRWSERLGPGLVGQASGVLPEFRSGQSTWTLEVVGHRRGRPVVGPLDIELSDPFGLVTRRILVGRDDHVVVLPVRHELGTNGGRGAEETSGADRSAPQRVGVGDDDVIARPYTYGDALKRWHWKATAHRGEPMVRQEERQLDPRIEIHLDTDERAYDDRGFEWAVTAAASVLEHFAARRFDVDLVVRDRRVRVDAGHDLRRALVELAVAEPAEPVADPVGPADHLVAVLGRVDLAAAARHLDHWSGARRVVAFVASSSPEAAIDLLEAARWRVVTYRPQDSLAERWAALAAEVVS